jgi:hypothetical protein
MDARPLIECLDMGGYRIRTMVAGVGEEQARWKPAPESWSILEVTAHLLDEEREDFRARLDLLLHQPGVLGPPIDPQCWVRARRYNERDLQATSRTLVEERRRSVAWLRGLAAPAWENALEHPAIGKLQAGDLLAAWAAHDILHVRQLARLHWQYIRELAKPYGVGYAGDWETPAV